MKVIVGEDEQFPFYVFGGDGVQQVEIEIDEQEFVLLKSVYDMFVIAHGRINDLRKEAIARLEEA